MYEQNRTINSYQTNQFHLYTFGIKPYRNPAVITSRSFADKIVPSLD